MEKETIKISGWKIIRTIGKGSFGTVYEVEKEDGFCGGIRSALKVISIPDSNSEVEAYRDDGYDDASLTALYKSRVEDITAEFRLMNKLKGCNNIVSYEDHAIVQHENDPGYDIFIRMELLTALPKFFDRNSDGNVVDENIVRKLGADICRALERCCRHNIIHRDIKPQNIFVNEEGDFKLGDFGIAKTSDHTTKATKTGTYGYMAPEVYLGKPYNASVDIYSLGLVLYWMLNERRGPFVPLPPEVPKPSQNAEALESRMHGEPLPPPKHGSDELKRIVLKACAFDPKDRYATPSEMRRDMELLSGTMTDSTVSAVSTVPVQIDQQDDETAGVFTKEPKDQKDLHDAEETVGIFAHDHDNEAKQDKQPDNNKSVRNNSAPVASEQKAQSNPITENKTQRIAATPISIRENVKTEQPSTKKNNILIRVAISALALILLVVIILIIKNSEGIDNSTVNTEGNITAEQERRNEVKPTAKPTVVITAAPTEEQTEKPMADPTKKTTSKPTSKPTSTPVPSFTVPSFETRSTAEAWCSEHGVSLNVTEKYSWENPQKGTVLSNANEGSTVNYGGSISITVSKGVKPIQKGDIVRVYAGQVYYSQTNGGKGPFSIKKTRDVKVKIIGSGKYRYAITKSTDSNTVIGWVERVEQRTNE